MTDPLRKKTTDLMEQLLSQTAMHLEAGDPLSSSLGSSLSLPKIATATTPKKRPRKKKGESEKRSDCSDRSGKKSSSKFSGSGSSSSCRTPEKKEKKKSHRQRAEEEIEREERASEKKKKKKKSGARKKRGGGTDGGTDENGRPTTSGFDGYFELKVEESEKEAEKKKEMHAAKERQERLYAPLPFIRMKKLKTKSQSNGALATLNAGTPAFDLSPDARAKSLRSAIEIMDAAVAINQVNVESHNRKHPVRSSSAMSSASNLPIVYQKRPF